MLSADDARSGKSTHQTPCDSASLTGTPSIVTLMRFTSVPLIFIYVYPTPVPASEETTRDGVYPKRYGTSCAVLIFEISSLVTVVYVIGVSSPARVAFTKTASVITVFDASTIFRTVSLLTLN